MTQDEAKTVQQVVAHAKKLHIPLDTMVKDYQTITVNNPIGFDFTVEKGGTRTLLGAIIDSGRFGYDAPDSLFGFLAGCVARRSGFKMSFREIGTGQSMHIQIGDSKCNVHLDSIGITPARDKTGANLYDFSKLTAHWDRDLRPELGPLKHFDVEVIRGQNELTGTTQWGDQEEILSGRPSTLASCVLGGRTKITAAAKSSRFLRKAHLSPALKPRLY